MPCLICGRLSEDLDWYKLNVDSGPFGHIGEVSVCPHCQAQAEFYPEIFLRKDMEASVRLHDSSVPYLDQSNPYTTVFVKFQESLESAVELAKTNKGNIDDCHLFETLGASSNDIRYHFGLKLPKEDTHGDTCSLYTFNDQNGKITSSMISMLNDPKWEPGMPTCWTEPIRFSRLFGTEDA